MQDGSQSSFVFSLLPQCIPATDVEIFVSLKPVMLDVNCRRIRGVAEFVVSLGMQKGPLHVA